MFLFIVFVTEYISVEMLYRLLGDWVYFLGDWRDFNYGYYFAIATVDLAVMSIVLKYSQNKTYIYYAALSTVSFFVNVYGLYLYHVDASVAFYLSSLQTIFALKLMLVLKRTFRHARIYARHCFGRVASCMAGSLLCLYIWEVVKNSQTKRWTQ